MKRDLSACEKKISLFPLGKATRDSYGKRIAEMGALHPDIVVLDGDLAKSTRSAEFGTAFPDRFFNAGIAEANMVGIAGGLAACGKIPFVSSFASFLICKSYDQIRLGVAYSKLPVKLIGSHGGITLGEDGVSQMSIEDVALMTATPGMTVVVPADDVSALALVPQVYSIPGPVFMRTGRNKVPRIYQENDTDFEIGRIRVVQDGQDIVFAAYGLMVAECMYAAQVLASEGINAAVLDVHTIKPLDVETLARYARKCGAMVTAEEHQIHGGMGSEISRALSATVPIPIEHVAIQDTYAKSGTPDSLKEKYGLTWKDVLSSVDRVLQRK